MSKLINTVRHVGLNAPLRATLLLACILMAGFAPHLYRSIWPAPYVSKQDNFKIVFRGTPTVNNVASQSDGSGGSESSRIYSLLNQKTGTDYAVYVTRYSNINFNSFSNSATTATLQLDIEHLAQTNDGNLSGGRTVTFKGLVAVEATLTPADKSEAAAYILAFSKDNDLYVLLGSGINQSRFNSFTQSYSFIS